MRGMWQLLQESVDMMAEFRASEVAKPAAAEKKGGDDYAVDSYDGKCHKSAQGYFTQPFLPSPHHRSSKEWYFAWTFACCR